MAVRLTSISSISLYTMIIFFKGTGIWSGVFRFGLTMRLSELEFLGQIASFGRRLRAASSGGGSNAPRPALSVPHLDVNGDEG